MDRRNLCALVLGSLLTPLGAYAADTVRITVRARVPEKTGTVYLTGNLPQLGPWSPGLKTMEGMGAERRLTLEVPVGQVFEFKLTLGSWAREAVGPGGVAVPNFRVTADAHRDVTVEVNEFRMDPRLFLTDTKGAGVVGSLKHWRDVPSRHLSAARHVSVWLPPGYSASSRQRYPVLYMHDGQNLFDARLSTSGVAWSIDKAVVRNTAAGRMPEVIVVGAWSTAQRDNEYLPWGGAAAYGRFLMDELMPEVNAELRTLTGPQNTMLMGAGLGAALSFDLCRRFPKRFGGAACLSMPVSQPMFDRYVTKFPRYPRGPRLYFDQGTGGLDADSASIQPQLTQWLVRQGRVLERDLWVRRFEGADPNDAAWRDRLDEPLAFLYRRANPSVR